MLADFEKLGAFYLGRTAPDAPYLYDSKHLTTHAVVIGMTGSGKTGLSVSLLEEAAIDGIPAIVVDPKGDLGNLLLTFPSLAESDFAPWAPAGTSAGEEASKWREGLAAWGQDGARIERLRAAADVALYTPGSRAGRPISILGFLAPPEGDDEEAKAERLAQIATSLLGLVGVDGGGREQVLLATILQHAWAAGESLDLAGLVLRIQEPPFDKIGVLGLESFFPKKERFELAIAYNGLLATPGFEAWLAGEPLDVGRLLWTKEGKPRISVLSIAHLADAERMFFVSLLLGQILSWLRSQPGTPALRALFFMDEIVGYFPPVAKPPSKEPLLLLLKQARAFGLGVVLATQNPVDLDYKGLANAGTWMIGRLQTERDKARVLEGLEGVGQIDRDAVDRTLSGLAKRHFYVHDIHAPGPVVIESRWCLSYLRGPLTKEEMKRLTGAVVSAAAPKSSAAAARPVLPPDVNAVYFPTTAPRPAYEPMLVGAARVHFADEKTGLDFTREVVFVTPIADGPLSVRWEDSKWAGGIDLRTLGTQPAPESTHLSIPSPALVAKNYSVWTKELEKWLTRTQGVVRLKSKKHKLLSQPNEDEGSFRARLALLGREQRDDETGKVKDKLGGKLAALEEKIRRKQETIARHEEQASSNKMDAAFAVGGGLLGAFIGRGPTASKIVRAAAKTARDTSKAASKARTVEREKEELNLLLTKYAELQREAQAALHKVASTHDPSTLELESVVTKPKKGGLTIHLVALAFRAST